MQLKSSFISLSLVCLIFYGQAENPSDDGNKRQIVSPELVISPEIPPADTTVTDTMKAEDSDFPLTFGFDLVSRYIWRGVDFGATPAFQPSLAYSVGKKNVSFEIGAWASYSITGAFAETDLYVTLSFPYVWVGLIDYFFPIEAAFNDDQYYHYGNNTAHVFEGLVGFEGPDKFPLTAFVGYNFHSPVLDSDNSLYFELGYPFTLKKDVSLDIFAGAANGSYYTQSGDFNVVNLGLTVSKSFDIKGKVQIPLSFSLITNPDAQKIYMVAAVGLWNQ